MRLQKIEVHGFKSFADRQVFHIDGNVTGVIGPNGCGKSNVVDAMRWCLGEQRVKHLRGSGMTDVIFSGSHSRGPAACAEVTITFKSEGDVPAPYNNYSELGITRRLYRDGTSEYLINKIPSRLRDITDLVAGTGIGARGYSIIEQGQVSHVVTSKPETRRQMLDEAAGITKFKSQRASAERRIEQTRQNLLRVTDVITELEGRIGTLRRQAQKAERYKRYRDELSDLELWIASHKFLELRASSGVLETRRNELNTKVEALRNRAAASETRIEAERIGSTELRNRLTETQENAYELENRIQLLEQDKRFQLQEIETSRQSIEQASTELEVVRRGLGDISVELEQVVGEESALQEGDSENGRETKVGELDSEHTELSRLIAESRDKAERARAEHTELSNQQAGLRARLESLVEVLAESEEYGQKIATELENLSSQRDELSSSLETYKEGLHAVEGELGQKRDEKELLKRETVTVKESLQKAEVEVETARKELMRSRSRLQSLTEIQGRYRSCGNGVQVVMQNRERLQESRPGHEAGAAGSEGNEVVFGVMADFISSPEHLEPAVAALLGDRLQGVVVDGPKTGASGVALLKELQEGRSTFLPTNCPDLHGSKGGAAVGSNIGWSTDTPDAGIEVVDLSSEGRPDGAKKDEGLASLLAADGVLGRMADLIEVDPKLQAITSLLLEDTVVVDGLDRALELFHRGNLKQTLVTPDGDRVEPTGVVVGGSTDALDSALLQQKREINELGEIVETLAAELDQAKAKQQGFAERLVEIEVARESGETALLEFEKKKLQASQAVETTNDSVERLQRQVETLRSQLEEWEATKGKRSEQQKTMSKELAAVEKRLPELVEVMATEERLLVKLQSQREGLSERLTQARVEFASWKQKSDSVADARRRLEVQVSSEQARISRLEEAASESTEKIETLEANIVKMTEEHAQCVRDHESATTAKTEASDAFDAARVALDDLEISVREVRAELEEERAQLGDVELGVRELEIEHSHIEADIRERFDMELREILVDFHDRALAGEEEEKRRRELKRILSRMGEVNLTAIDEFEEVSERYEYLSSQRSDLEAAIEQLREAIEKINGATRDRFQETFTAVNEQFQRLFPRLFHGGKAELVLTDPTDLLNTGVDIMAQPPGKRVAALELMSGGEKALTAVSLIFGIFLIKPSPFCLLDEVDAPLDDANIGRLCELVRDLSKNTQFLVITHNKRTMEMADRLYGVTMQQRGVSKLVTVDMKRTTQNAQIVGSQPVAQA